MKLISLNCNHCGAPLEVSEEANFVTCAFCETRLGVERSGSAYSTRILEELQEQTASLTRDVAAIKLQNNLELLDREWHSKRQGLMITRKEGAPYVPTSAHAIGFAVLGGAASLIGIAFGMSQQGSQFVWLGLIAMPFVVGYAMLIDAKATKYRHFHNKYKKQRAGLVAELAALSGEQD